MKFYKISGIILVATAIAGFAASYKLNNLTSSGINTQGTALTNQNTLVVSDNPTNEYVVALKTATVTLTGTAYTNNFGVSFTSTPMIFIGAQTGTSFYNPTNYTVTVTTTNLIVSGLSTNAVTGFNNINLLLYGTQRSGTNP